MGEGVRVHASPCTTAPVVTVAPDGESFNATNGGAPQAGCNYTWYSVANELGVRGWVVSDYLEVCGGALGTWNRFGVGLVSEGSASQYGYSSNVGGTNGWILLLFAGINNQTTGPQPSWVQAVASAYGLGLNVVVRLSPPWGAQYYRAESDDAAHMSYQTLAGAFKSVVAGLPRDPSGRPLYLMLDNEPDLCYEWFCATPESQPLTFQEMAAEYAHFASDVADALHSLNDPLVRVSAAALAPGGGLRCGCCGAPSCPADSPGITGLQYMQAMMQAVPDVFAKMDFLSSHAYPASGIGWGFNAPFPQAGPGLWYFAQELQTVNRSMQVLITETGWATHTAGLPTCTEQEKADWTVAAYQQVWGADNRVQGVTPFMLQDATWGDQDGYAYVLTDGTVLPVLSEVQSLRCSLGFHGGGC